MDTIFFGVAMAALGYITHMLLCMADRFFEEKPEGFNFEKQLKNDTHFREMMQEMGGEKK